MTAETLTPEQRAHDVATFLNLIDDGIAQRVITAAIRAAVEAERARCADIAAKPIQAMIREKHKQASSVVSAQVMSVLAVEVAALEEAVEKVAAAIRVTPTTEPSHDR